MEQEALARFRAICAALPGTSETVSHAEPTFWVGGRTFANFSTYHHDDTFGVWLNAPEGAQAVLVDSNPERFFVPKYVGGKGWVGVRLEPDRVDWEELAMLVEQAHQTTLAQVESARLRRRKR